MWSAFGQLTSIANANSSTSLTAFDTWGRVTASTQQTGGQTYNFTYGYNLAKRVDERTVAVRANAHKRVRHDWPAHDGERNPERQYHELRERDAILGARASEADAVRE